MISYKPLAHTLVDKGINRAELGRRCGFSPSTLARLGKDRSVNLTVIERLCLELGCRVQDVVEILPDTEEVSEQPRAEL